MKKTIIASILALGIIGVNTAQAADSEVNFIGAVTAETCDLSPAVGGTTQLSTVVQLGTVAPGENDGTPVNFSLKAANPAASGCANLEDQDVAHVSWTSPAMNAEGLGATAGTADDAVVILKTLNAKDAQVTINNTTRAADFEAKKALSDGLQFSAQLKSGQKSGDFQSVAAFAVSYK